MVDREYMPTFADTFETEQAPQRQTRRFQAACAAITGLCHGSSNDAPPDIAAEALLIADALISAMEER